MLLLDVDKINQERVLNNKKILNIKSIFSNLLAIISEGLPNPCQRQKDTDLPFLNSKEKKPLFYSVQYYEAYPNTKIS